MKVSDLAAELGIPPSAVLEQCQRFGIEAAWAGAELSGSDLVVLRAELANADDPIDLRPADGETPAAASVDPMPADPAPSAVDAAAASAAPEAAVAPPTAVASMPDAAGAPAGEPAPAPAAGGFRMAGATVMPTVIPRKPEEDRKPTVRRLDHSTRTALVGLVAAVAALGAAEAVRNAWTIWALWLLGGVALFIALWNGNKGRRHVTTHPEKVKGLGLSVVAMVLAIGGLVVLGTSVYAAVGSSPAKDAPAGLGDRDSVASARWGYQRLRRVASDDWNRPAKDVGTCWVEGKDDRDPDRIEQGTEQQPCAQQHTTEVIRVYAFDRDADSEYPGSDGLAKSATAKCGKLAARVMEQKDGTVVRGVLMAEIPTEHGWSRADHDIACVIVAPSREGSLLHS